MPKLTQKVPAYRKHSTGQAIVVLSYKTHYLGKYGSKSSKMLYDRLVAEWLASDRRPAPEAEQQLTITELLSAYWKHCKKHYRGPDGRPTSTLDNIRYLLKPLKRMYGDCPIADFGPRSLKALVNTFIVGKSRRTGNMLISQVKAMFRYGLSEELLDAEAHARINSVKGLERGRSEAKEPEPVMPVADCVVEATMAKLPQMLRDMVALQRLLGVRPGEIVAINGQEIDQSGETWFYRPKAHKTSWRGKAKTVAIGPRARAIVEKYLAIDPLGYLFKPSESEAKRLAEVHAKRKTPIEQGNAPGRKWRPEGQRKRKRRFSECYTVDAYRRAITRAATAAGVEEWSPNQLRHTAATKIREEFGLEGVKATLGHSSIAMSENYAKGNEKLQAEVASKLG